VLDQSTLQIDPLAETFLYQADRAQHFASLVLPALEAGQLVITDRCFDASIAYQGFARNVGPELIAQLSLIATQGHIPDLTILLDLEPDAVHHRTDPANDQHGTREIQSRMDIETAAFHSRVREGFRLVAKAHPARIHVLDAGQTPAAIHQQVIQLVESLIIT
jgi:dTMP kinase